MQELKDVLNLALFPPNPIEEIEFDESIAMYNGEGDDEDEENDQDYKVKKDLNVGEVQENVCNVAMISHEIYYAFRMAIMVCCARIRREIVLEYHEKVDEAAIIQVEEDLKCTDLARFGEMCEKLKKLIKVCACEHKYQGLGVFIEKLQTCLKSARMKKPPEFNEVMQYSLIEAVDFQLYKKLKRKCKILIESIKDLSSEFILSDMGKCRSGRFHISSLPDDLMKNVISFMDTSKNLLCLSQVSKRFKLISMEILWQSVKFEMSSKRLRTKTIYSGYLKVKSKTFANLFGLSDDGSKNSDYIVQLGKCKKYLSKTEKLGFVGYFPNILQAWMKSINLSNVKSLDFDFSNLSCEEICRILNFTSMDLMLSKGITNLKLTCDSSPLTNSEFFKAMNYLIKSKCQSLKKLVIALYFSDLDSINNSDSFQQNFISIMDNLPNTLQSVTFIRISDTDRVDQDLYEILVKRHLNSSFFDLLCKSKRDQSYFFSSLRELTLDEVGYSIDFFKLIRPIECPKLKKISIDLDFATPSNQGDQIAASDVLKELGNLNLSELCVNFPRNFSENVSRTFLRFENLLVLKVCMDRVNWASNLSVMFDNLANLNTFEIHFPIDRVRRQVDTPQLKSFIDLKLSSKILKSLQLIDWNQHRIFTDPGEKLHSSSLLDTLEVSNHLLLKFPNLIEFEICMDCNMTNPVQNSRCLLYSKCIYYQQSNSNNNNKRSNAHTN